MLTFDPEKHHYFWNKKRVPGVSEIIKTVGLGRNYESVDTFYRDRGIAVHKAIEFYLKGTLDESSLDPILSPYFRQAKEWLDEHGISPARNDCSELRRYNEKYNVAGTIDFIFLRQICDWKCTKSVDPITEIQGAFYKVLMNDGYEFMAIQLDGSDGPALEIPYQASPKIVDAVMTLYHEWKKK